MKTLPYVGLALVIGLAVGWGAGMVTSTRVNTIAARTYAESLDLQVQSEHEKAVSGKLLACEQRNTGLTGQIADGVTALALEQRARADDGRAAAAFLSGTKQEYSERIIGLREQLHAAGIDERIVKATR